jgi:hypothetical protein
VRQWAVRAAFLIKTSRSARVTRVIAFSVKGR